jgi:short subunit dehydrogenase-like uncharacterized protein
MSKFLIYGANGYTGEIIARKAFKRGLKPILGGRSLAKLKPIADELGFVARPFSLEDKTSLEYTLKEVDFVLHCAGPFSITSKPMVEACLRLGKHYLDITGEIAVFEAMASLDLEAKKSNIMIMPGVGFDVVPSDCLALHLKNRLPSATNLTLAFMGLGGISHGTQATMTMNVGNGGSIRKDGKITKVPSAWRSRNFDFGDGKQVNCTTIPWGDVSTAFYSAEIPNIEVFAAIPESAKKILVLSRYIGWLLATKPLQSILQSQIPVGGPSEETRKTGSSFLYGEASDNAGNFVSARLQCPEGYETTALAAMNIVEKIINGNAPSGFQTPAKAYGADLILEIERSKREDIIGVK